MYCLSFWKEFRTKGQGVRQSPIHRGSGFQGFHEAPPPLLPMSLVEEQAHSVSNTHWYQRELTYYLRSAAGLDSWMCANCISSIDLRIRDQYAPGPCCVSLTNCCFVTVDIAIILLEVLNFFSDAATSRNDYTHDCSSGVLLGHRTSHLLHLAQLS